MNRESNDTKKKTIVLEATPVKDCDNHVDLWYRQRGKKCWYASVDLRTLDRMQKDRSQQYKITLVAA